MSRDLALNTAGGRYRLQPLMVDAIFYDGLNTSAVLAWARERGARKSAALPDPSGSAVAMIALRSPMDEWFAFADEWVVYAPDLGFDTQRADDFAALYEPVEETP